MDKQYLESLFEYKDGKLFWKVSKSSNIKIGSEAGCADYQGYKVVRLDKKQYKIHRLIFLMLTGLLPRKVDHIDGNPANNDIQNLRDASDSQNQYNRKINKNNKLGVKGVHKQDDKYVVQVQSNKNKKYVGSFDDLELAELVAIEARDKYHGRFAK